MSPVTENKEWEGLLSEYFRDIEVHNWNDKSYPMADWFAAPFVSNTLQLHITTSVKQEGTSDQTIWKEIPTLGPADISGSDNVLTTWCRVQKNIDKGRWSLLQWKDVM